MKKSLPTPRNPLPLVSGHTPKDLTASPDAFRARIAAYLRARAAGPDKEVRMPLGSWEAWRKIFGAAADLKFESLRAKFSFGIEAKEPGAAGQEDQRLSFFINGVLDPASERRWVGMDPCLHWMKIDVPQSVWNVVRSHMNNSMAMGETTGVNLSEAERAQKAVLLARPGTPFLCLRGHRHLMVEMFHAPDSPALAGQDLQRVAHDVRFRVRNNDHHFGHADDHRILFFSGKANRKLRQLTSEEAMRATLDYLHSLRAHWLTKQPAAVRRAEEALAPSTLSSYAHFEDARPGDVWRDPVAFSGNRLLVARVPSFNAMADVLEGFSPEIRSMYDPDFGKSEKTPGNPEYLVRLQDVPPEIADLVRRGAPAAELAEAGKERFRALHGNDISEKLETPAQVFNALTVRLDHKASFGHPLYADGLDAINHILTNRQKTPFLCLLGPAGGRLHFLHPAESYLRTSDPRHGPAMLLEQAVKRIEEGLGDVEDGPDRTGWTFFYDGERVAPVTPRKARAIVEEYDQKVGLNIEMGLLEVSERKQASATDPYTLAPESSSTGTPIL